jgi:Family of unknown function (DUF6011)
MSWYGTVMMEDFERRRQIERREMTHWRGLSEGYYAVPDPLNEGEMSYWRRKDKGKHKRPAFDPWPLKAKYGPRLLTSDPRLKGLKGEKRRAFVRGWYESVKGSYMAQVVEAIAADPVKAGKHFAELQLRCCMCGRRLTTKESKVIGIGPECRQGLPKDFVDNYFPPLVGEAHYKHLHADTDEE